MPHLLSREALGALCALLTGVVDLPVGIDGEEARLILAPLPGRAVVSAARVRGVLYMVMDYEKAGARSQLWRLIQEWRVEYDAPEARLAPSRVPPQRGAHLSLVS